MMVTPTGQAASSNRFQLSSKKRAHRRFRFSGNLDFAGQRVCFSIGLWSAVEDVGLVALSLARAEPVRGYKAGSPDLRIFINQLLTVFALSEMCRIRQ